MSNQIHFGEDVVQAYPSGWTCVGCGAEFSENSISVECLYVIETDEGTQCLKCVKESEAVDE